MDVLKHLDVLIGLALVMVLVSPLVTAATQFWMWIRNRRTIFLQQMLHKLLVHIGLRPDLATAVVEVIVRHPHLSRAPAPWKPSFIPELPPLKNRHAEVIEREEFIRVLLEVAADEGAAPHLLDPDRAELRAVLRANGVDDPAAMLSAIRTKLLEFEKNETQEPTHARHARAIAHAAPDCALVGKVTHWFDAAAARATQQYAAEARAVTVAAALLVALALQLDTLHLLHRLSSDAELTAALVEQAQQTQAQIDEQKKQAAGTKATPAEASTETQPDAELAVAKARQEEIEKNLAILRSPQFKIVPDHFAWTGLAVGRVDANPIWKPPFPTTLTLIAGGTVTAVPVRWRRSPIDDIRQAIDAAKAPVRTRVVSGHADVLLRSPYPVDIAVTWAGRPLAVPVDEVIEATMNVPPPGTSLTLFVDDASHALTLTAPSLAALQQSINDAARTAKLSISARCEDLRGAIVKCSDPSPLLVVAATTQVVRDIRLVHDGMDVLGQVQPARRLWRVPAAALAKARYQVHVSITASRDPAAAIQIPVRTVPHGQWDAAAFVKAFNAAAAGKTDVRASEYAGKQLVITATRSGPLELRASPDAPHSNILNSERERAYPILGLLGGQAGVDAVFGEAALLGIALSWVLLSFGGPFWYDMLKNLLKLRPSAAATEERNRTNRSVKKGA